MHILYIRDDGKEEGMEDSGKVKEARMEGNRKGRREECVDTTEKRK